MDIRDCILNADDILVEEVSIPEWNTSVFVRGLTAPERDAYEASFRKEIKRLRKGKTVTETKFSMDNARVKLAVLSICKSKTDLTRVFSDDDIPAVSKKSAVALNRVFEVAARLAGITTEDMDELAGN